MNAPRTYYHQALYTSLSGGEPLVNKTAIILAWIATAIWFGALHLPAYDWNVVQAVLLIGVARLVLTLAFIRTKNIAVSFGVHLLNDWVSFTLALIAAASLTTQASLQVSEITQ